MKRALRAIAWGITLIFLATQLSGFGWSGQSANQPQTWTIMVYMADDTSSPLPWRDNVNAMEAAVQAPGTSVVVLIDQAGFGNTMLLKVQHDSNASQDTLVSTPIDDNHLVIPMTGEVNTAAPGTLSAFIGFSATTFPADKYVLILWGHGSGWRGLCPDGIDFLTLPELRTALSDATADIGRKLDVVAIDACTEGTMEMLYEVRGYTDYYVAAETNIPYQGLPYTRILNRLAADASQTPESFGKSIVEEYIGWSREVSPYSATMALFDMSGFQRVADLLEQLSAEGVRFDNLFHTKFNSAFSTAEQYDIEWYVDFGDAMDRLQASDVPHETKLLAIQSALAYLDMVSHFESYSHPAPADNVWVNKSKGLAIYVPSDSPEDAAYSSLSIASTIWDEFGKFARVDGTDQASDPEPTMSYVDLDEDQVYDEMKMEWQSSYDAVTAWVFRQEPGGLVFLGKLANIGSALSVPSSLGYFGKLVLSASGSNSGIAESYALVTGSLAGTVMITVELKPVDQLDDPLYDLRVTTASRQYTREDIGHAFAIAVGIPEDADIGGTVTVEVLDRETGDVVASWQLTVPAVDSSATMLVASTHPPEGPSTAVLLLFSLLPGILVLVFALMLNSDRKKKA